MTIKDLYSYAKSKGATRAKIFINYDANDCWYSLCNASFSQKDVTIVDNEIFISVSQDSVDESA